METLDLLANGFEAAFTPMNLLYAAIGVLLGTFVGVLPDIAGIEAATIGVWAYVVAGAVLLAGMLVEGI